MKAVQTGGALPLMTSTASTDFGSRLPLTWRETRMLRQRTYTLLFRRSKAATVAVTEELIIHCLKNVPHLACYNFNTYEWIFFYIFGRNVTGKVGNQKTLYYTTSNNLCFCTTWQNAETRKSHFSLNWIVLHTQCTCVMSSWKKKLSSVMCLIASNICWDSKISH